MFTGIIEELGIVLDVIAQPDRETHITIGCKTALQETRIGDSICVNGTCLTAIRLDDASFTVGLSPETLRRTSLGQLRPGAPVNLERSLAAGQRMGGHYVQGHVDGTAEIVAITPEGEGQRMTFRPPAQLMPYIVEKGYVAVDGISLTVADRDESTFSVALIAHTLSVVNLAELTLGSLVNIEVDIIAKYVESILGSRLNVAS